MYSQVSYFKYSLDSWPWRGAPEKHTVGSWGGEGLLCRRADGVQSPRPSRLHRHLWNPCEGFPGVSKSPLAAPDTMGTRETNRGGHTPYLLERMLSFCLPLPRNIFAFLHGSPFFHSGSDTRSWDTIPEATGQEG